MGAKSNESAPEIEILRRRNADLERQVAGQVERLREVGRELDIFAYAVSHDLRAPLRAINGFSEALLEDHGASLDAEGRQYLERVRSAAVRMNGFLDGLLRLSRFGRAEMHVESLDLGKLAQGVADGLAAQNPGRRVDFVVGGDTSARGDAVLLRALLECLLENAWKFTGKKTAASVEVDVARQGAERVFLVRDNGAGFDMRQADKLFGPLQRLHSADEFEGVGMGLAIAQRIVSRHGGRIWAEGRPGAGATFFFTL